MTWKIIVRIPVFYRNKIFSCRGGVRVRGDELTWTIREKYLFPDPSFYAIIDQYEVSYKRLTYLIIPKNY